MTVLGDFWDARLVCNPFCDFPFSKGRRVLAEVLLVPISLPYWELYAPPFPPPHLRIFHYFTRVVSRSRLGLWALGVSALLGLVSARPSISRSRLVGRLIYG